MSFADLMAEVAMAETRRAHRIWNQDRESGKTIQMSWSNCGVDADGTIVGRVVRCLRDGLGVEDMAVTGTCTAEEARQVISWMRRNGSLAKFYARAGK